MKRAILYFLLGSIATFLANHFIFSINENWKLDLFYGVSFGLGWGLAYFVDRPDWALAKKMGFSFIGIAIILIVGFLCFDFERAIPSVIRFSTIFVAYYLLASFKETKSLRY